MSERRVATGSPDTGKPGEAVAWQRISPYKTRAELSGLLDEVRTALPLLIERSQRDEDLQAAFRRATDPIKTLAMGFNLDYVTDRIAAMAKELRSEAFGSIRKPQQ